MPEIKNISNKNYENLIEYLCKTCDCFSFTISIYHYLEYDFDKKEEYIKYKKNVKNLMLRLEKDLIKKTHTPINFLQLNLNNSAVDEYYEEIYHDEEFLFDICFFKISENSKKVLKEAKNLFSWVDPNLPEDLMFIKNDYIKMHVESQEKYGYLYCESENEYNYLKELGVISEGVYDNNTEELCKNNLKDLLNKINKNR